MSTLEPVDEFLKRVETVEDSFRSLQDDIALRWVNDDVGDMDTQLRDLPTCIQHARARGYVFKSYLERKADVLAQQWTDIRPRVTTAVDEQARNLRY